MSNDHDNQNPPLQRRRLIGDGLEYISRNLAEERIGAQVNRGSGESDSEPRLSVTFYSMGPGIEVKLDEHEGHLGIMVSAAGEQAVEQLARCVERAATLIRLRNQSESKDG